MSTFFSIRCDGPTCEKEAHRRLSDPAIAIPGAWQVLKLDQGKDGAGTAEDLHFCSVRCLAEWSEQGLEQAAAETVQMAAPGMVPEPEEGMHSPQG